MSDRETLCAAPECAGKLPHKQGELGCHFYLAVSKLRERVDADQVAHDEIRETLNQRGANYGTFMENARISGELMAFIEAQPGWNNFHDDQRAATWIIMQKLARALSGNAQYDDNWRDIAGYAQLIVDRINGTGTYAKTTDVSGLVTDEQCASDSRCTYCYAPVGHAHDPACRTLGRKKTSNFGRSTGR